MPGGQDLPGAPLAGALQGPRLPWRGEEDAARHRCCSAPAPMASERPDRFDAVIQVRSAEVDRRLRAFSAKQLELRRAQDARAELVRQARVATPEAAGPGAPLDLGMRQLSELRGRALRSAMARQEERTRRIERDLEVRRAALVEAKRAARAAEVLKERLLARLAAQRSRRERVAIDEVAVQRYRRR